MTRKLLSGQSREDAQKNSQQLRQNAQNLHYTHAHQTIFQHREGRGVQSSTPPSGAIGRERVVQFSSRVQSLVGPTLSGEDYTFKSIWVAQTTLEAI